MIKIAIADDHTLIRSSLMKLLQSEGYDVIADAENGKELIEILKVNEPDIVLMDCAMPLMDGIEATEWITKNKPRIRVIALSMNSDDMTVIRIIRAGARGFVPKGAKPDELNKAIQQVAETGYYHSDLVSGKMMNVLHRGVQGASLDKKSTITNREEEFLKLCCSEMAYKEIADKMCVSIRTVDGYRESLFEKLEIKSRVGLVLYSIKNRIVVV